MSARVIIVGTVPVELDTALAEYDVTSTVLEGVVTGEKLTAAGIETADSILITDLDQATIIPVAKDLNPAVTVVTYDDQALPEFATKQTDFAVDPALVSPVLLVEELLAEN